MKELKSSVEFTEDKSDDKEETNESLDEGMMMSNESADKIRDEMKDLKNEASEKEKEISKVGEAMLMMMDTLQKKADDIENIAETSLDRQKQLFDSHIAALNVLESLSRFQSQVLEESRGILQQLIEVGHSQQQELIQRQQELKQAHGHLVEHSKSISAAKETFESKQASMFLTIDRLFNLHDAILLQSHVIKGAKSCSTECHSYLPSRLLLLYIIGLLHVFAFTFTAALFG
ncbi:hypothetical protein L2E82_45493 [Cichorium intybus]|uniref:Uncharacterized protein n=1 Tax=Cichorium intybus TaxID=13427 RepID=A0ACB8ZTG5_CICIN|nr:hypothetical protein L2E82_45493 [Cichorium intybus]